MLWDPESTLSQHQHPLLNRRQTSGDQTLLLFSLLFNDFTFCLQLFPCHTSWSFTTSLPNISVVDTTKPSYYTFYMYWSEISPKCTDIFIVVPFPPWHFSFNYTIYCTYLCILSMQNISSKFQAVHHICSAKVSQSPKQFESFCPLFSL